MCDQAFEINSSPCRVHAYVTYIKHVTYLLQVTWCTAMSCTMSQCKLPARINSRFSFIIIVLIYSGVLIAIAYRLALKKTKMPRILLLVVLGVCLITISDRDYKSMK